MDLQIPLLVIGRSEYSTMSASFANRRVTHLRFDVEMVELEYGMEFKYLFGVPDEIPDITRSFGMVRRIRFIYRMSFYVN